MKSAVRNFFLILIVLCMSLNSVTVKIYADENDNNQPPLSDDDTQILVEQNDGDSLTQVDDETDIQEIQTDFQDDDIEDSIDDDVLSDPDTENIDTVDPVTDDEETVVVGNDEDVEEHIESDEEDLAEENSTDPALLSAVSPDENFEYINLRDGTIGISYYLGSESIVSIPSSIDGKTVSTICGFAFEDSQGITKIILPDSITYIEDYAFSHCGELEEINLPDSISGIEQSAFEYCTSLTSIRIPANITEIRGELFSFCSSLSDVTFSAPITSIGYSAFYGCSNLKNIAIPESVISIEPGAFASSGIESITIPESVTTIEDSVFNSCSSLSDITFDGPVTSIGYCAFQNCSSLESIVVPETVTSIGTYAFDGCSSLSSIVLNCPITSINDYTFRNCSSLDSIVIPESVDSIGTSAFEGCSSLEHVNLPSGLASIEKNCFMNCRQLAEVSFPASVTIIKDGAFSGCSSLESITIPASVISIGRESFRSCSGLTTVNLNEGLQSVGSYAFYYCRNLRNINFPSSLTEIGSSAFSGCPYISDENGFVIINGVLSNYIGNSTVIRIPDSVHTIGDGAFSLNSQLASVTIPSSVARIGNDAFGSCSNLQYVSFAADSTVSSISNYAFVNCGKLRSISNLPDTIETIGTEAFALCTSLTSFTFPDSLISIGYGAFEQSGINSVSLPASVSEIGECAFAECSNLKSLNIVNRNIKIGYHAFQDCDSLPLNSSNMVVSNGLLVLYKGSATSVTIPSSIYRIADHAFYNCTSLQRVTIPSSVTSIGDYVFSRCTNLTAPTLRSTLTHLGEYAFEQCTSFTNISIPDNVLSIPNGLFSGCSNLETVSVSEDVNEIGEKAFENCTSLTSFEIPSDVTEIRKNTFYNCQSLSEIVFPYELRKIDDYAFTYCYGLKDVTLPANVSEIGRFCFGYCKNLESIDMTKSLETIGYYAFYGCEKLNTVYYHGNYFDWERISVDASTNKPLMNASIIYYGSLYSLIFETGKAKNGNGYSWDGNGNLVLTDFEASFDGNPAIQVPASTKIEFRGTNRIASTYNGESGPGNIIKSQRSLTILSYRSDSSLDIIDAGNNNGISCSSSFLLGGTVNITSNATGIYFDKRGYVNSIQGAKVNINAVNGIGGPESCDVTFTSDNAELKILASNIGIDSSILDMGDGVYDIRIQKRKSAHQGIGILTNRIIEQVNNRNGSLYVSSPVKAIEFKESANPIVYLSGTSFAIVEPDLFEMTDKEIIDLEHEGPIKVFSIQPYRLRVINGTGTTENAETWDIVCIEANKKEGYVFDKWVGDYGNGLENSVNINSLFVNETTISDEKAYIRIDDYRHFIHAKYKIAATEIQLNKSEIEMNVGDQEQLTATVYPDDATYKTISWTSDNPTVASVDSNGNVTANAKGTANIIATAKNDTDVSASCEVTVVNKVYNIAYNLDGGTNDPGNPSSYTVESDTIILKDPSKTGYAFVGWYDEEENKVSQIPSGSTGDINLTARWQPNDYTYNIIYVSESGISLGNSTVTKSYGTQTTVSAPDKQGYITPVSQEVSWDSVEAKTITFTYGISQYDIGYELNAGTNNPDNPSSYTVETDTITLKDPVKTGYTFIGWTGSNGSTPQKNVSIPKGSTGDKTYTANWNINTYEVSFDSDGGTSIDPVTVQYNTCVEKPSPDPVKQGYSFVSWKLADTDYDFDTPVTEDITLTASYNENTYKVIYEGNGHTSGSQPDSSRKYSASFILPASTGYLKTGYSFTGWYDKASEGNRVTSIHSYTDEDVTVYAYWLKIKVSSITLDKSSLSLNKNDTYTLKVTVSPSDAYDTSVSYISSAPMIVSVDDGGNIRALKEGTATITVSANDGSGTQAKCEVTVTDSDPVSAFIRRLYDLCLERQADEGGLSFYKEHLEDHSMSASTVVRNFFASPEMKDLDLSREEFIRRCYRAMMDREAGDSEVDYYLDLMNKGLSRMSVVRNFVASPEFANICEAYGVEQGEIILEPKDINDGVTEFVIRCYTEALGRAYEEDGLNFHCSRILSADQKKAMALEVASNGFFHSPEFLDKKLDDESYIKVLYHTFLGREAEPGGLRYYMDKLAEGGEKERDVLLDNFAASDEFANIMKQYGIE